MGKPATDAALWRLWNGASGALSGGPVRRSARACRPSAIPTSIKERSVVPPQIEVVRTRSNVAEEVPEAAHAPADESLQPPPMGMILPFVVLLLSLYTISGGIRLEGDLPAYPATNTAFLAVGSLMASVVGTTGAAMLLVRPLLETNRERKHVRYTGVFFIFVVCNCGGCLLPTGDPPLFLGYLLGVPFLWTLSLWKPWLFVNTCLLVVYFLWDHFLCYRHESKLRWAPRATSKLMLQVRISR